MMKQIVSKLNVVAVLVFIGFILLAQWVAPKPYVWTQNTVSELASQGYTNKWIMQLGFLSFGLLLTLATVQGFKRNVHSWLKEGFLSVYALCIFLTGIFCTAPFIEGMAYVRWEANLHSLFATVAGVAFSMALLLHMITDSSIKRKLCHLITLVLVTAISVSFGLLSTNIGIVQRLLYSVSFLWLIFVYHSSLFVIRLVK